MQRSILEADQEEENEEAGDMNDDEINEIIARSDEETALFHEIDLQRSQEALEAWRRAGNRGKPPPPLMQLEELPDCYRTDEPFENKDDLEEIEGRGQRRKAVVNYSDGLSDDQWAMVRTNLMFYLDIYLRCICRLWKTVKTSRSCPSARGSLGGLRTTTRLGRPHLISTLLAVDGKQRRRAKLRWPQTSTHL